MTYLLTTLLSRIGPRRSYTWVPLLLAFFATSPITLAVSSAPSLRVRIYYDEHNSRFNFGKLYVNQLRNLIGHFHATTIVKPVQTYGLGEIDDADAVFYLGTQFDAPLPDSFLTEASNRSTEVVWIGFNIWQLLGREGESGRLGLLFEGTTSRPNRVSYKNETLFRSSEELLVRLAPSSDVTVHARAFIDNDPSFNPIPYAIQAGSFWYISDNPFTFNADLNRDLVLADLLHEIFKTRVATQHRALLRIEDINPGSTSEQLMLEVATALDELGVPASYAVIPRYRDPTGQGNSGAPQDILMSKDRPFLQALHTCRDLGIELLVHGYTHQRDNQVSGVGYEFWNERIGTPRAIDSFEWASSQVDESLAELAKGGFYAPIWETPHYSASLIDYVAFASRFDVFYERLSCFNALIEGLSVQQIESLSSSDLAVNLQVLPYTVYRSVYDVKVLPENLGFFRPEDLTPTARSKTPLLCCRTHDNFEWSETV